MSYLVPLIELIRFNDNLVSLPSVVFASYESLLSLPKRVSQVDLSLQLMDYLSSNLMQLKRGCVCKFYSSVSFSLLLSLLFLLIFYTVSILSVKCMHLYNANTKLLYFVLVIV